MNERPGELFGQDIYACDLGSHTTFAVTDDTDQQIACAISGNTVVWADNRATSFDIWAYDLAQRTQFAVTRDPRNDYTPAVSGSTVVWARETVPGLECRVFGKDLGTPSEFQLSSVASGEPSISGDRVAWADYSAWPYAAIEVRDLATHEAFHFGKFGECQVAPDIAGDRVVYEDIDLVGFVPRVAKASYTGIGRGVISTREAQEPAIDGNIAVWEEGRDIYGYDLLTRTQFQITSDLAEQRAPDIFGNTVVWSDYRNGRWDIYGATLDFGQQQPAVPEPASGVLLALVVGGTGVMLRQRRKR